MRLKSLLIILLLINLQSIIAQELPIDSITNKITFTNVTHVKDSTVSKDQLYSKSREWFAKYFKSSKNVLQMDDKESGKLIGKGSYPISITKYLTDSKVDFTISIYLKKGRYKYNITDFNHISYKNGYSGGLLEDEKPDCGKWRMMNKGWVQVKEQTNVAIHNLILDLEKAMNKNGKDENDDW